MQPLRLTRLESTLLLACDETKITPGYQIVRPPMPTRRAVSVEEFEATMRDVRAQTK